MSVVKTLQAVLSELLDHLKSGAVAFFSALAHSIEQNGGQVLRDAAKAAVAAAEAAGGSGEDKAKAAFAQVVAVLANEGLPIVTNAIKGAIEAAVADLKAVAPAPGAPAA